MVALFVVVGFSAAQAVLAPSLFEGSDGNKAVDTTGNKDWASFAITPHADTATGANDSSLNGNEDDTSPKYSQGGVQPNKSDLTEFLLHTEQAGGSDFLYLGWSRVPDPSGNVNVDFELNKLAQPAFPAVNQNWNLARSEGDLLFGFELVAGGTVPNLSMSRWMTAVDPNDPTATCVHPAGAFPCWGDKTTLNPTTTPAGEAAVGFNGPDIVFGEASINLQAAGIFTPGACTNFGSAYAKSRSSGSGFRSQLSDVIAPVAASVTNCGSLTVVKNATRGNGTFTFDVDCSGGTAFDRNDEPITTAGGTGQFTIANIPKGTSCTVTEDAATGWTPVGATSQTSVIQGNETVTFDNDRDHGKITVDKTASGGDGTFGFDVACPGVAGYPVTLSVTTTSGTGSASTAADIPTGTTCTVKEAAAVGWTVTVANPQTILVDGDEVVAFANKRNVNGISIDKTANLVTPNQGEPVTYSYVVKATGPDPLHDVSVTDDKCAPVTYLSGDTDGDKLLDPGESWVYQCVSSADASNPTNIGTAVGFDPLDAKVTAQDTETIAVVAGVVYYNPAPVQPAVEVLGLPLLARTGSGDTIVGLTELGAALVLLGGSLLVVGRRRRGTA